MPRPALSSIPLLREISREALAEIEQEIEWFSLPAGWSLFEATK